MIYRPLGRTGESVSLIGIGGSHIGKPDEDEGVRIIRTAVDRGVNFMDNCWDYSDGKARNAWAGPCATATGTKCS